MRYGAGCAVADIEIIKAPLYLKLAELQRDPPVAAECPACFAVVLVTRLEDHKQAAHG